MQTVTYETRNATFYLDVAEVLGVLNYYATEYKVNEATKLLRLIESSSSKFIKISSQYFGFVVLTLTGKGKGTVFCKICQKTYLSSQLSSVPFGFGKSPFESNFKQKGGIFKRFFGRKKRICGSGGQGYLCPQGHELIGMITWTGLFEKS